MPLWMVNPSCSEGGVPLPRSGTPSLFSFKRCIRHFTLSTFTADGEARVGELGRRLDPRRIDRGLGGAHSRGEPRGLVRHRGMVRRVSVDRAGLTIPGSRQISTRGWPMTSGTCATSSASKTVSRRCGSIGGEKRCCAWEVAHVAAHSTRTATFKISSRRGSTRCAYPWGTGR